MIKRLLLVVLAVGFLSGCQSLSDPEEVQDALLNFYPAITSVTLNDNNVPVIAWDNPNSLTREVAGAEIYIKTPTMSSYPSEPQLIVTSNSSFFTSKKLFNAGFGTYKFKMKVVDTDDIPGSYSEEYSVYFSGFQKSLQLLSEFSGGVTMDQPYALAHDNDGNVYIADTGNHRILKLNSAGELIGSYGSQGSGSGKFQNPQGICVGDDDRVYVSDTGNDRIVCFESSDFLGTFSVLGETGSDLGEFNQPVGCYVFNGNLLVADVNNNRVQVIPLNDDDSIWDVDSIAIFNFRRGFVSVWNVAGYNDKLIFVDKGAHKVYIVNASGDIVATLGQNGTREGELLDPRQAVYDSGRQLVFIANHGNHTIDAFNTQGIFQYRWGVQGSDQGELSNPVALSLYLGKAFVLERSNERLQVFKL